MTSSSFKKVVRLQFNALMMRTIKGTLKQKRKQLARYSKHEILFSEISTSPLYEQGTLDTYSCNMTVFRVQHFIFRVTDEKISTALSGLSERQRAFILLYYFRDMSDREISELYHISRSAVGYTRNCGLRKLEELMKKRS
ncbi:TPA: sigma-70 family RNA polymerase sigma factor [Enterococcus faecium]|nr:sigma-70 family RNA polymerase sigma factor [Enterococcus faecium]HBM6607736.1 sigma-70 family RNA polymerase sigma factor [Enterococcus faecium]HBM6719327.1 sigma-70 family RNA polymerase sigma factor [Enterococcus faecium]